MQNANSVIENGPKVQVPNGTERIEAILFDMDGTLIDSEPIYREADSSWLAGHGIQLSLEEWDGVVGFGSLPFIKKLKKSHGLKGDSQELLNEKDERYLNLARKNIQPFPEMKQLLKELSEFNLKKMIASGSSLHIIEEMADICGISSYFQSYISAEEVPRGKPNPDIFLEGAKRLGVEPERCLVIEDSSYGVEAALSAGMISCAIPFVGSMGLNPSFEKAHILFSEGMSHFSSHAMITVLKDYGLI